MIIFKTTLSFAISLSLPRSFLHGAVCVCAETQVEEQSSVPHTPKSLLLMSPFCHFCWHQGSPPLTPVSLSDASWCHRGHLPPNSQPTKWRVIMGDPPPCPALVCPSLDARLSETDCYIISRTQIALIPERD